MTHPLTDPEALRLLALVASPHLRAPGPPTPPPAALLAALADAFSLPPDPAPPPTDAALARAALAVAAENPTTADRIETLLEDGPPPIMGPGKTLAVLAAAIAILQTEARIEHTPSGQWTFTLQKPATSSLTTLAHAIGATLIAAGAKLSPKPASSQADVLILTAIKEEYDAVLLVHTGAEPGSAWQSGTGPTGFDLASRSFLTASGARLRVAVIRSLTMGMMAAASAAAPIVTALHPRCLAMCGVCAGRRGDVNLGDVIIADKLWTYDTGAVVRGIGDDGRPFERFKAEPLSYNLSALWKHRAEGYSPSGLDAWVHERPRSLDHQTDWLLARLRAGHDPVTDPDTTTYCNAFTDLVPRLRARGLLEPTGLALTAAGRAFIDDRLLLHLGRLPEPVAFSTRLGPIATGTNLVRDPGIFDKLSDRERKVLALEMEAAAIGAIAHEHGIERTLVMKGVMDHADKDKSDVFKAFAARASAECLIAFLRDHWES